jgi:formylglycine-generating enzyme required for sulfatase activity
MKRIIEIQDVNSISELTRVTIDGLTVKGMSDSSMTFLYQGKKIKVSHNRKNFVAKLVMPVYLIILICLLTAVLSVFLNILLAILFRLKTSPNNMFILVGAFGICYYITSWIYYSVYKKYLDDFVCKLQDIVSTAKNIPDTSTNVVPDNDNETSGINFGEWDMVYVEGGSFTATLGDTDDNGREIVINKKVKTSDFYIGRYPVTRAQWFSVMEDRAYETDGNLPVEGVSWEKAQLFIAKLNEKTGKRFRLPAAVEWEYAATGGKYSKGYKFSGSDNADEVAWYADNSEYKTHEVGTKKSNELGIHDMSGNVWEWCADRWGNYQKLPTFGGRQALLMMRSIVTRTGNTKALEDIDKALANPQEPAEGAYRVRRGCFYSNPTPYVNDSIRFTEVPDDNGRGNGFRLAHDR